MVTKQSRTTDKQLDDATFATLAAATRGEIIRAGDAGLRRGPQGLQRR